MSSVTGKRAPSVDLAACGLDDADLDAGLAFEALPGEDPRGVFLVGPDDDVAGFEVHRGRHAADAVGRTLCERDRLLRSVEVVGDDRSRLVEGVEHRLVRARFAEGLVLVVFEFRLDGVDDPARARPARAGVEIDRPVERRDVGPQVCWIHHSTRWTQRSKAPRPRQSSVSDTDQ